MIELTLTMYLKRRKIIRWKGRLKIIKIIHFIRLINKKILNNFKNSSKKQPKLISIKLTLNYKNLISNIQSLNKIENLP
jgi:hypothetical protein